MVAKRKKKLCKDDLERAVPKHPSQILNLVMDFPPSVNHMYVTTKTGMRILKKDAKNYFTKMQKKCLIEMINQDWKMEGEGVWLYLDMVFYMPDKRKRDSHNGLKILLDILNGIPYVDDYYVMPNIKGVYLDRQNPRVEMILYAKEVI